jgi:hypothetical protein
MNLTRGKIEKRPDGRAGEWRNAVRAEFKVAPEEALFGDDVAAVVLDTTTTVLGLWRMGQRGPKWVRVGKSPKYRKSDLLKFIEENVNEPR